MKRVLPVVLLVAACGTSEPPRERRERPDPFGIAPEPPIDEPDLHDPRPVLPEDGPHPDYPTPRRAGTDELFLVEEPERGPHVTEIEIPDRKKLELRLHAYCEIDLVTVVCGDPPPLAKEPGVRVGSKNGRPVLVEWLRAGTIDQTVVMEYDPAGAITRMALLDGYGDIDWVRTYQESAGGLRYTSTLLSGGNALSGCGSMDVAIGTDHRAHAARCLQWSGPPMRDMNGVATTEYERDKAGFEISETRLSPGGSKIAGKRDGVYRSALTRDAAGRPTAARYFTVDGAPAPSSDEGGCYGLDFEYARNQRSRETCLGADGQPAPNDHDITTTAMDRDRNGCLAKERYLDPLGNPASDGGVSAISHIANVHCTDTSYACLDAGGTLVACDVGEPAEYLETLDAHGRIVRERYSAPGGGIGYDSDYYVEEVRWSYDALGRETGSSCHSRAGDNLLCGYTGYHRSANVIDSAGRIVETRFFDVFENPTTNLGATMRRTIYDNYDHQAEQQQLGPDGALVEVEGMATKRIYYDDSHRLFGVALLDKNGQPADYRSCFTGVTCPQGQPWHAMRIIRSATGRTTQNLYFDKAGQLIATYECTQVPCW